MISLLHNAVTLLYLASLVTSQDSTKTNASQPSIYRGSGEYKYYGCYNETTQIQDSAQDRALADGTHLVRTGRMTVPLCLEFCASNGTEYKYAGLEWSRYVPQISIETGLAHSLDCQGMLVLSILVKPFSKAQR
ncbi:carbohydrate-binding wsc [Fusarium longipes]|uniref:Carbohydrate-binding wsc n=1 Tax=Fusarium longipes TaxID=694270 RepID=A0A395S0T5_9HYPO|nr:carbohydrate-binding wsc [Fusarium longipes]